MPLSKAGRHSRYSTIKYLVKSAILKSDIGFPDIKKHKIKHTKQIKQTD